MTTDTQAARDKRRKTMAYMDDKRTQAAHITNCTICGRIIDTREKESGGDDFGCQMTSGAWICSDECSMEARIALLQTDTQAAVAAALMQAAEKAFNVIANYPLRTMLTNTDNATMMELAILALIPADAMAALEAVKVRERMEAEKEILCAAGDEYTLEHASEGSDQRFGRRAAVRGMMVRLGLYDKLEAAIDTAMEAKP